jgi:hypothetical protein
VPKHTAEHNPSFPTIRAPSGSPTEPYSTGLDDDEVSGDLLVSEATQPCLESRVERLDGPFVGEAGHDDPVMRAEGEPHEVREAEVATQDAIYETARTSSPATVWAA